MTEMELKLMFLRYNMLSKEKAIAAYMCQHTDADECIHYGDKLSECTIEMRKMEDDLRKDEYRFVCTDYKTVGKVKYEVYKIAPANNPHSLRHFSPPRFYPIHTGK